LNEGRREPLVRAFFCLGRVAHPPQCDGLEAAAWRETFR
jgi:hypothetical protein